MKNLFSDGAEVRPVEDLATLARQINKEHEAGESAAREGLEHFRAAGEALLKAKAQCGHGKWLAWLAGNVKVGKSRAYQYIALAKLPVTGNLEDQWRIISGNVPEVEGEAYLAERPPVVVETPWREEQESTQQDGESHPTPATEELWQADQARKDAGQYTRHDEPREPIPSRAKNWITVDEWKAMSSAHRKKALAGAGDSDSGFNRQENDSIEWARWSWNPVSGCLHDCPYCYARDIAERFYPQKFEPSLYPGRLGAPGRTRVPDTADNDLGFKNVFTCSMADLFGRWVPQEWIEAVLNAVRTSPQWNFLFLTKFPIRLAEFEFPDNAWVGTTVDCQIRVANAERAFRKVRAKVKWLSCEPMIERLKFSSLEMFQWIVIGGASASSQTPEWHPPRDWSESLRRDAIKAGCEVYEKTNLLERFRNYPGFVRDVPASAPKAMVYLPVVEK